ncbi:hypothetical protein [Nonomuraea sp. NPDC049695]|uniref:hypothetical protein n=1 Tax=Nonomuraea sp. NPDC049695 TaxID=3154734 RepID=UPI0034352EBC
MSVDIRLETNHGTFALESSPGETVESVLRRHGVPLSAVFSYVTEPVQHGPSTRQVRFVPTATRVDDEAFDGRTVILRVTRNIDLPGLMRFGPRREHRTASASTEWLFPSPERGAFEPVQTYLGPEECMDLVRTAVCEVLDAWPAGLNRRVVVGTSGGGDSNVLLASLIDSGRLEVADIHPVMMLGIPDWDTQLENARQLCASLGLTLEVVDADHAAMLAGVRSLDALRADFAATFPDADLEFLGTWLLRKVLSAYAAKAGADTVAIGANREDVVAEALARVSIGELPLPVPFRPIGETTFVYPMHRIPKKIGDGAFPTFSVENYEARAPSHSGGRTIFYYAAYLLADSLPGMDVTLFDGLRRIGNRHRVESPFEHDADLDDLVLRGAAGSQIAHRWRDFLARHLVTPQETPRSHHSDDAIR